MFVPSSFVWLSLDDTRLSMSILSILENTYPGILPFLRLRFDIYGTFIIMLRETPSRIP
jgi:hypothetical protein